ncbi:uncharacterized protein H6S33_004257 [Morchella sextelata]|uniref:uncharacterized protein n=1 Tax=Morchella sextelata TaxID=1174677 RepID=UPI001D03B660|nr:uncharacterized protein H6S33_004257 [Morchella sextelata]KAH0605800.1 hypothetical protein H6S33_004257 [Morchella sextelata]
MSQGVGFVYSADDTSAASSSRIFRSEMKQYFIGVVGECILNIKTRYESLHSYVFIVSLIAPSYTDWALQNPLVYQNKSHSTYLPHHPQQFDLNINHHPINPTSFPILHSKA